MSDEEYETKPFKRSAGSDHPDVPASKRLSGGDDDQLSIKLLIPAQAVGAIIGKGGEAMRQLKNDNNCKVQMSKTSDTYPNTTERVCLIKGKLLNVVNVIRSIQEKIFEKCEGAIGADPFDHKGALRGCEMKIVMPNTSAGMVIGKSGANIKEIRDNYGCQIQVFPKHGTPEAKSSTERVVTLAHDDQNLLVECTSRVLEKVAADPHHGSEISKDDGAVGGANKQQSFAATANTSFSTQNQTYTNGTTQGYAAQQTNGNIANYGYQQQTTTTYAPSTNTTQHKFNPMSNGLGNNEMINFFDNLQGSLRTSGFNESSVAEVMSAMQVLAKYNIMGLGLGLGVAAMAQIKTNQQ